MKKMILLLLVGVTFFACGEERVASQEPQVQEIHINDLISCYGYSSIQRFTNGERRYIKFQNRSGKDIKAFKAEIYIFNDFNEVTFTDFIVFDSSTEYNSLNTDPSVDYIYDGFQYGYTIKSNEIFYFHTSSIYDINDSIFPESVMSVLLENEELRPFDGSGVNIQYSITDIVFTDGTVYSVDDRS
ncbi:MAG: hypothetical protein JXR48_15235 [Candidatus Delongbacteria bacterium]|nr:hypothetical protein [Candidatus Delongbacteria bacterium]